MLFPVGTLLVCIEAGLPSMLVVGKTYVVTRSFIGGAHGPIVQLDNGATTYVSKFIRAESVTFV